VTRAANELVQFGPEPPPQLAAEGVVMQGTGGVWEVRLASGATVPAALRGRLKHAARGALKLAVGDRVTITWEPGEPGAWYITEIHGRRSQLARRSPTGGHGERVIVANVDQVLVVFAIANPEPHPRMLDRFLAIAEANGIAARIVVNKVDLASEAAVRERFAPHVAAGYPLHCTSAKDGTGLHELGAQLAGRTSVLTGPSGVGKSSLMNALFPGLDLRTAAISESVNKGRHTTVGAMLHPLPGGGFIADTPGLREVGLWGIEPSELAHCFPEFRPLVGQCRFADCAHLAEPGCAVRERGGARYESYVKLREELEVDRRRW
jgi:ribosome biogenesis GTPase